VASTLLTPLRAKVIVCALHVYARGLAVASLNEDATMAIAYTGITSSTTRKLENPQLTAIDRPLPVGSVCVPWVDTTEGSVTISNG
jgi:hypothetical protein